MVATAEANGVYHVKVTGIVADLGILGGEIKVEQVKAKATSISAWLGQKAQGLWDTAKDVVGTISKSYDAISLAAHTTLSGLGVIPGFGVVPDLADFALTAVEIPFGKSDGKDLGLATLGVFATVAPGPVDGLAAGAKITTRLAKAGARVADGAGAAGRGLGDLVGQLRHFLAPKGLLVGDSLNRALPGGHVFDKHAHEWFGIKSRDVFRPSAAQVKAFQDVIERVGRSGKSFEWSVQGDATVARLAKVDGKYFVVQHYKDTGVLATAFIPKGSQLRAMLKALRSSN
jgi:hypothetical protein